MHRAARLRPDRLHLGGRPLAAARAREPLRAAGRRTPTTRCCASGRVFEYWAHEACLLPSVDEPHFRRDNARPAQFHRWYGPILQQNPELADEVMALARERDEISARDFGGAGQGLLGVDAGEARARRAVDGGAARDRRPQRAWSAATPCPSASCRTRCSGCPRRRSRRRGGCRSSAPCAPAASPARRASPTTTASRAGARRSPPRSRSSSAKACSSGCACASSAMAGSCPPRTPSGRSPATTGPRGAFLLSPVRQPALGSLRGRAPVRLRAPPRDLQAGAHAHLRLLRAAAARRLGGRRPDRRQGRPQGRYAAGAGGALAGRPRPRALREALARLVHVLGLERSEIESGV